MKKLVLMMSAASVLIGSTLTEANAQTDRRAAREQKKMMRQEARMNSDRDRILKENHRQRKQMYRESRRANRKQNYEVNTLGNVYKGL